MWCGRLHTCCSRSSASWARSASQSDSSLPTSTLSSLDTVKTRVSIVFFGVFTKTVTSSQLFKTQLVIRVLSLLTVVAWSSTSVILSVCLWFCASVCPHVKPKRLKYQTWHMNTVTIPLPPMNVRSKVKVEVRVRVRRSSELSSAPLVTSTLPCVLASLRLLQYNSGLFIFTTRRYAGAVYATAILSVCLSVTLVICSHHFSFLLVTNLVSELRRCHSCWKR